ncbi:MAG: type II toxin-antitoxin system ParD family antitoxin [Alphaproteobacteria bacterium]|nr:type II toxin-antitoxin system ParD family antitoxin [Alphaproteobacteria bacterium]
MKVSLTPKLEDLVRQKVQSGLYRDESDVVREALRLLQEHDEVQALKVARLREELAKGDADIEAGRGTRVESPEDFEALFVDR